MTFKEKIRGFFAGKSLLDEAVVDKSFTFDELCDILVEGDFGAADALAVTEELEKRCKKAKCSSGDEARAILRDLLVETLAAARPSEVIDDAAGVTVVLLLGVNGVGKTTTAAKLASRYAGMSPILAAADTFRAGAIDQLKLHGERLGLRVVAQHSGSDPAAVVFDAVRSACSGKARLVIADTAGRMHTKSALIEELKKIDRAVQSAAKSESGLAPICYLKYLVLDATTGRNALSQAEVFNEAVSLDGIILSKCDSTAKGGAVFTLAREQKLSVVYLCTGEKYTDIEPFDAALFADRFLG
jgi:fused signal recognition particle receptor